LAALDAARLDMFVNDLRATRPDLSFEELVSGVNAWNMAAGSPKVGVRVVPAEAVQASLGRCSVSNETRREGKRR
jgi:hypothetical protein